MGGYDDVDEDDGAVRLRCVNDGWTSLHNRCDDVATTANACLAAPRGQSKIIHVIITDAHTDGITSTKTRSRCENEQTAGGSVVYGTLRCGSGFCNVFVCFIGDRPMNVGQNYCVAMCGGYIVDEHSRTHCYMDETHAK